MTTIDKILIGCAAFLAVFTVTMVVIFCIYQAVPDTLIDAVFGAMTGEAALTFAIWWIKKRSKNERPKDKTNKP